MGTICPSEVHIVSSPLLDIIYTSSSSGTRHAPRLRPEAGLRRAPRPIYEAACLPPALASAQPNLVHSRQLSRRLSADLGSARLWRGIEPKLRWEKFPLL